MSIIEMGNGIPATGSRIPICETVKSSVRDRISTGIIRRWLQLTLGARTRFLSCQVRSTIGEASTSVGRDRNTIITSAFVYSAWSNNRSYLNQFQETPLAHDGVAQIETGEFYLLGVVDFESIQEPVIKRAVVFKFQSTNGIGNPVDGI